MSVSNVRGMWTFCRVETQTRQDVYPPVGGDGR